MTFVYGGGDHPLMDDTSDMTDEELSIKINKVFQRMQFFANMGNSEAYQQANNIYMMLSEEMKNRSEKRYMGNGEDSDPFEGKIDIS